MSSTSPPRRDSASSSPAESYNKSKEFWALKEAVSNHDEPSVPVLSQRTSSRALLSRTSLSNLTLSSSSNPALPKLEVQVMSTPPIPESRKSARRDSSKKKAQDRGIDKFGTPSAASETDQSDDDSESESPKTPKHFQAENPTADDDENNIKVTAAPAIVVPVASRSSSESSVHHSRINSTRRESTLSASATPDSVLSRKRGSSTRSPSASRGSSDSPTRLRKVSVQDRELTNSGSFPLSIASLSDTGSSPSKRPSRSVSSEIHALKHELERERADRNILEAIVHEHQKLIETLNSKLERQSKILLSLQQSVEMFSRPQRIGHSPAASLVEPTFDRKAFDAASKEDDEDDNPIAPRKSKSARALSSSIHTKSKSKSSNEGEDEVRPKFGSPLVDFEDSTPSHTSKANKRKSKSSKELVVNLDSTPNHTPIKSSSKGTSEASSSSINSDAPPKKSKDKEKEKEREKEERLKEEKEEKLKDKEKDKEKRKSSRKSMVVVMDPLGPSNNATGGFDTPLKGPSSSAATSPASSVASTPVLDSKKEKRKSRRVLRSDDEGDDSHDHHGRTDSAVSGTSIHFNSNPSIIPPYAGASSASPDRPSAPRRSKSASERKPATLRATERGTASPSKSSRKKEAVTDVEDFSVEKKKRKVRRTVSDPDNPNGEPAKPAPVDDIVPVKMKKKRRSERPSDRNGASSVEIKSERSSDRLPSGATAISSPELSKRIKSDAAASLSDRDSVDKRSKSSPTRIAARRKAASVSAGSHSTYVASPSPDRRKARPERNEGDRKDSSASESYEPLAVEAAHESNSHEAKRRASAQQTIFSPGSKTQFRLSSRKLEMEEENALSPKRREVTSTRHAIALDLGATKLDSKSTTSDAPPSPSAGDSGETPRGTSSSQAPSGHSPRAPMLGIPALTISRGSSPSLTTSNEAGFNLDLSLSSTFAADPARAQFEQERNDREANILSPRGRDAMASSTGAPPLTSRSMAVHYLQTLPCNDIGVPVFLEQVCKFLLAEGTSCVALFEKRVDYARLENLRRKLDQTMSLSGNPLLSAANALSASNAKLMAGNIERDLKGEDPYVVAGVLKRWFMDQPDTLLMGSKSRYWLDVLEITNTDLCIAGLQTLYYSLDLARRRVLRFFVDFLKQFIVASSGVTTLEDVSSRMGPLLLRLPGASSPHATARGEPSSTAPASAIPSSIQHTNSSSNLSGSTDDTHAAGAAALANGLSVAAHAATALQSSGTVPSAGNTSSFANPSALVAEKRSNSESPSISTTASAVPTHTRIVSRRGSARLEYELPPPASLEGSHLPALLLKYLITRDSEILKNHDQGIEFSRRPDLQYVVRAASPAKILMLLIDQNYTEREFSQVIWDTCVYYTKPVALLSQFMALYDKARGEAKWQSRVRMRILMAIKTWVKHSNFSLGPNKEFRTLLQRFSTDVMKELKEKDAATFGTSNASSAPANSPPLQSHLLSGGSGHQHTNSSSQVLDPESRILHSIMNASMFEIGSDDTWIQWKLQRLGTCEPFKYALHKHEPSIVAGQLAMIHCRLLSMIHASELTDSASLDPERSPNYTGVVQHINCVSTWVAYDILCRSSHAERIRIITFYIDLAEQLLALGDFMGCWAIRGAFDLHPVSRLSQTWERLPRKESSRNKKLAALFEPRLNFVEYRRALDVQLNEHSFAVPILAFVPKDIIRLESNEPTFSDPGLVDVDKLRSLYFVLQYLSFANTDSFLKLHPTLKPNQPIWDFFANLPVIQEATLEQLSYNAEPRLTVPQNTRRIHSTSVSNPHRPSAN